MRPKFSKAIIILLLSANILSCVSQKKYDSLEASHSKLTRDYNALGTKNNEALALVEQLKREKQLLQTEVDKIDDLNNEIVRLKRNIDELENLQNKFKDDNQKEMAALLKQLQHDKDELTKKEDELREHNKKLIELQNLLKNKDKAVADLRTKVSKALLGFEGKGLSVVEKKGQVYVSMDEKLLFKSGRYTIEPTGVEALKELAKVLEQNEDINIMVEGHTDNVPYKGSGNLSDNWDLSVKRATTVVRTLLEGSTINPLRVIASGHSEYNPISVNDTAEGRQQNRRTEIILTPKIDELLEALRE